MKSKKPYFFVPKLLGSIIVWFMIAPQYKRIYTYIYYHVETYRNNQKLPQTLTNAIDLSLTIVSRKLVENARGSIFPITFGLYINRRLSLFSFRCASIWHDVYRDKINEPGGREYQAQLGFEHRPIFGQKHPNIRTRPDQENDIIRMVSPFFTPNIRTKSAKTRACARGMRNYT